MNGTKPSIGSNGATAPGYEAIADDPKYQHFIRIPRRIVRCLDYFRIDCDRVVVERRLGAYYLFIGVIDHAIDSGKTNVGEMVLRQLSAEHAYFGESINASEIVLTTEKLKSEIPGEISLEMLKLLRALHETVEKERTAASMRQYIEVRKRVGQLTARSSHVLIRSLISSERDDICHFMERVGEIGCLVDSVIDLHEDSRRGLLNFRSTPFSVLHLLACTFKRGAKLSIEYPRLFSLFLEAVADNVRDRFRARAADEQPDALSKSSAAPAT